MKWQVEGFYAVHKITGDNFGDDLNAWDEKNIWKDRIDTEEAHTGPITN